MNSDLVSRPYQPDQAKCCERCVFGRGEHADWCVVGFGVPRMVEVPDRPDNAATFWDPTIEFVDNDASGIEFVDTDA